MARRSDKANDVKTPDITKRFSDRDLYVLHLHLQGMSMPNISEMLGEGYSVAAVSRILRSSGARAIMDEWARRRVDTLVSIQDGAQAAAQMALDVKIKTMMTAKSEALRDKAATDILGIAGHKPVSRAIIESNTVSDPKYADKSEAELKALFVPPAEEAPLEHPSSDKLH